MLSDDYSVSLLCDLLGCRRSSYYYQTKPKDETEVKSAIQDVVAEWPTYGYRRVTKQLQRQGWDVNKKRVRRLMRAMGLLVKTKRKARKTTNSEHEFPRYPNLVQNLEVVRPDQVWVSDITYIRLRDEFVYLAVIYAAEAYLWMLRAVDAEISMAEIGEAWQNGYAERLVRTIKEEEVDLSEYECYNDAVFQLGRFLNDVYMHKRIHSSLGYLTPAEFEERWQRERQQPLDVH